jgi:hypothetical protein
MPANETGQWVVTVDAVVREATCFPSTKFERAWLQPSVLNNKPVLTSIYANRMLHEVKA